MRFFFYGRLIPSKTVFSSFGDEAGSYDFTLEIPVKVGQYLHYLKDSIDDPNAKVQFKDDVCTCNFTVTFIH